MDPHHTTLIIGIGGLGAPCAMALAAAGIQRLILVDPDTVSVSNLHRQPLFHEEDVGRRKVEVAAERLTRSAPGLRVIGIPDWFDGQWDDRFDDANVIVDGTDTVAAKFLVNDAAVRARIPLIHAGAMGWQGQLLTVLPTLTACYRCVFEEAPPPEDTPSCNDAGVLGPAVAFAGTLQAAEVLRVLHGEPPLYANRLLSFDLSTGRSRHVAVARRAGCHACDAPEANVAGRSLHP